MIQELSENKNEEEKGKLKLYQNESLDLMNERWAKLVRNGLESAIRMDLIECHPFAIRMDLDDPG